MATYKYKARDKSGKAIEGLMTADSKEAVAEKLQRSESVPLSVALVREGSHFQFFHRRRLKVNFSELNLFTRQLFSLQKAGLPILSSLIALREQSSDKVMKEAIGQMIKDIEGGLSLSAAMLKYPQIFSKVYISMVKSGEVSGRLDEILERLAVLGEHEEKIRLRINAAMRYPIIVVSALILGFMVLITVVVPRFAALYSQFDTELPLPTQILIGINFVIVHFWWLMVIIGLVFIYQCRIIFKAEENMFWLDRVKLKMPIFGPLLLKLNMSRFSRVTGTLLRSGVPILDILDLVGESVGNAYMAKAIGQIKQSVSQGKGMLEPMKNSGLFPPVVTQMVSVGEATGKIDELLLHVSDYYDSQIDHAINNLVTLIEPILIFFLGSTVLLLALGIFLPMWSLMSLFKK